MQAANIWLGQVLSNIMGQSGRALLAALAAGESDPEQLVGLVRTKIRASRAQVVEAVRGRLCAHQRLLLRLYLAQVDALDAATATIDHELGERLEPVQETVQRLTTMPGLSPLSAAVVISEIGIDMSRFPTAGHLISWAGLCPRNDESAGKRRSTRLRPGAPWLKAVLVQSAWCAVRVKASYLQALFQRLKSAPGPPQGDCGGGGRHADGDLPHAEARGGVSRSWARSLPAHRAISSRRSPSAKARRTRLRRHPDSTGRRMTVSS